MVGKNAVILFLVTGLVVLAFVEDGKIAGTTPNDEPTSDNRKVVGKGPTRIRCKEKTKTPPCDRYGGKPPHDEGSVRK
ncbi:hypothetical protein MRB53_035530 [Persea americana]|uniref:Uncharacterized protein n=1 Tax=Persea americana TaxID=3435 RepID=A0ACC2K577_PERAE|nr:hypothetical protein MRB53_035530 [Persea americana]